MSGLLRRGHERLIQHVLLGAAGILTVALGFASQTSASNVISGLFLLGERPFFHAEEPSLADLAVYAMLRVLRELDDVGYDGFVTIELYPYEETAEETARGAMRYLEEHGWI